MGVSPDRYPVSMKMSYEELCARFQKQFCQEYAEKSFMCGQVISNGKYDLMPGAMDTINLLSNQYRMILVTRGHNELQERKIQQAGLNKFFSSVYIVLKKDESVYKNIIEKENLTADKVIVIGDSILADINPALSLGITAVHIPYEIPGYSWHYEDSVVPLNDNYIKLNCLDELPEILIPAKVG